MATEVDGPNFAFVYDRKCCEVEFVARTTQNLLLHLFAV